HLLRRYVLLLSSAAFERADGPWAPGGFTHRSELSEVAALPVPTGGYVRTVGHQSLREATLSHVFKAYTEKVWGISCSELKAEWAAQRIKDLSLRTALLNMFITSKRTIKTLIDEFDYPRYGPGMMWNAVKSEIERRSGIVRTESEVVRINRTANHIDSVVVQHKGRQETIEGTDFISSMPIAEFVRRLEPRPAGVVEAAARLRHRDFVTVVCIVNKPQVFPDNWIYIHDPEVRVGRI